MSNEPLILEIKGNSLDDGPGIRTVVFFKGCPLACVWCHNPESKKTEEEISFAADECITCDTCLAICPQKALDRANPFFIDRMKCNLCFDCVESCPSGALSRVGRRMTHKEIVEIVLKDKPFYDSSGGGVTLSGGEPTMYMDFVSILLKKFKEENLHILLETCGYFDYHRFEWMILPYIDIIFFDIKLFASDEHKRYCGIRNEIILDNFSRLWELSISARFAIIPRIPLIPGITDTESNLRSIAGFLLSHGVYSVRLLPYNPLWHKKSFQIGVENPLREVKAMREWLSREHWRKCKEIFKDAGIPLVE